jgi:small GTP-binding protein
MSNFTWKIIIIGDGSVGKTSLINRYIENKFQDSYIETIGIDMFNTTLSVDYNNQKHEVSLLIYDLGGQEYWKKLRSSFYNRAKAVIMVYDISRKETFFSLENWYKESIENIGHEVPTVILGNKFDLENKITEDEFKSFISKFNFDHYFVSAKTGKSVTEVFNHICQEILATNSI